MAGEFRLLGRGNAYYSEMLRWKRLPCTGVKKDLQARVLRYVRRVARNNHRKVKKNKTNSLMLLLRRLPTDPVSHISEYLDKQRHWYDYMRTFKIIFGSNIIEKSFMATFFVDGAWKTPACRVLVLAQGVESKGDDIICYVSVVKLDCGEIVYRIPIDNISLVAWSHEEYQDNDEMMYYASAAVNANDERIYLKNELNFLECEEILLSQMCETMAPGCISVYPGYLEEAFV